MAVVIVIVRVFLSQFVTYSVPEEVHASSCCGYERGRRGIVHVTNAITHDAALCISKQAQHSTVHHIAVQEVNAIVSVLQEALRHIPAVLDSLAVCARFPEDSCNFATTAGDATEAVAAEEETANMLEKRQELFTLFRNTAKLAPEPAYTFVGAQLQGVMSHTKACWQVRLSTCV